MATFHSVRGLLLHSLHPLLPLAATRRLLPRAPSDPISACSSYLCNFLSVQEVCICLENLFSARLPSTACSLAAGPGHQEAASPLGTPRLDLSPAVLHILRRCYVLPWHTWGETPRLRLGMVRHAPCALRETPLWSRCVESTRWRHWRSCFYMSRSSSSAPKLARILSCGAQ